MVDIECPEGVTREDILAFLKRQTHKKKSPEPEDSGLVIFKSFESGHNQLTRVYREIFKSRELFHVRTFYREDDLSPWQPGRGYTFKDESIDDLIEGLEEMRDWIVDNAGTSGASRSIYD
jgi:hypothetical protein